MSRIHANVYINIYHMYLPVLGLLLTSVYSLVFFFFIKISYLWNNITTVTLMYKRNILKKIWNYIYGFLSKQIGQFRSFAFYT